MRTSSLLCGLLMLGGVGCTSVGSSAIRTDGALSGRHVGAVRVYAIVPPQGVRVIGVVEVHAVNEEANVETLMPVFMKRVADIGGTGGVVDQLQTHYELRTEFRQESYSYPCGHRQTCWGTRLVPYQHLVRILSIQGRALLPADPASDNALPASAPTTAPASAPTTAPASAPTTAPASGPAREQGEKL
jgi:hypothetical protein